MLTIHGQSSITQVKNIPCGIQTLCWFFSRNPVQAHEAHLPKLVHHNRRLLQHPRSRWCQCSIYTSNTYYIDTVWSYCSYPCLCKRMASNKIMPYDVLRKSKTEDGACSVKLLASQSDDWLRRICFGYLLSTLIRLDDRPPFSLLTDHFSTKIRYRLSLLCPVAGFSVTSLPCSSRLQTLQYLVMRNVLFQWLDI